MDTNDQSLLQHLADEGIDDVALLKKVIAHYKAGGFAAASQDLGEVVKEAQEDFAAVTAALPVIKAGYKTTEFWLVLLVLLGNGAYLSWTGKALPFDLNATLAALVGIYAVIRGLAKKDAATPLPPIEAAK